jgi:hypothetical protein
MSETPKSVVCVRRDDTTTWCGKLLHSYEFRFEDVEHSQRALAANSYFSACELCLATAAKARNDRVAPDADAVN